MTELNTTTKAEVGAAREEVERLRKGLNEYDSDLSVEQRLRVSGASESLQMASVALIYAVWNLGRVEEELGRPVTTLGLVP